MNYRNNKAMYKRINKLALIVFTSLVFFTTASYAEDKNLKVLMAQISALHNEIINLQEENEILKKKLASRENEAAGYRITLENIEADIARLKGERN